MRLRLLPDLIANVALFSCIGDDQVGIIDRIIYAIDKINGIESSAVIKIGWIDVINSMTAFADESRQSF